jgi:adenine-specific DNA-methyltransferase
MPSKQDKDAPSFQWGPTNPHPLSQMHTELVWEGKYDEFGRRREVDVAALSMPMQRIETVDEPRARAAAAGQLEMFEKELATGRARHSVRAGGEPGGRGAQGTDAPYQNFRNRLIWGDNKLVMASLLKEFKGRIDLIYIDPPFDVGADFTMDVPIGDGKETIEKDQSTLEMVAYRDMWGKGTDSYLHMMYERLSVMKELLSETGSIYVHCDYHVNYMIRVLLEDVFGQERFVNEIIWKRKGGSANPQNRYGVVTDTIFHFAKTDDYVFEPECTRESEEAKRYIAERFRSELNGRKYMLAPIERNAALGIRPNLI